MAYNRYLNGVAADNSVKLGNRRSSDKIADALSRSGVEYMSKDEYKKSALKVSRADYERLRLDMLSTAVRYSLW